MLVERLFDEPRSRLRSALLGEDWLGYSPEVAALFDLYDLMGIHAQVSAQRKRISSKHFKERPQIRKIQAKSLAQVDMRSLAMQINS